MLQSLGAFTDNLLALGVPRVIWLKAPVPLPSLGSGPDQQAQPARHEVLHRVIDDLAVDRPAVKVIDLAGWLSTQPVGSDRAARVDGVHWSSDASLLISEDFLGAAVVQAALS
jgi:hypothetical protein